MTNSTPTPASTRSRAPRGIRRTAASWLARGALAGALLAIGIADFPPGPSIAFPPGPNVALAAGPEYSAVAPEDLVPSDATPSGIVDPNF